MSGYYKIPAYTKVEADNRFVNTAGDTMAGNLNLGNNDIINVNVISATEIHTMTAYTHYQDILISELSGFSVTGNVEITGNVVISGNISADNLLINSWNTVAQIFSGSTIVTDVTSTGIFLTLTVNGSALAIPLYRY